jgi:hypothetical protein
VRLLTARIRIAAATVSALVFTTLGACQEPANGPLPDPEITVEPAAQWSGGVVHLVSEAFSTLPPIPHHDRWANVTVLLGSDTLDHWCVDSVSLGVNLPHRVSGEYVIELEIDDGRRANHPVQIVGLRRASYWTDEVLNSYPRAVPWMPPSIVAYGVQSVVMIDLPTGSATEIPGLSYDPKAHQLLNDPGPSYHPDRLVIDLPDDEPAPVSWIVRGTAAARDTVVCHPTEKLVYAAVELAQGRCLGIWHSPDKGIDGSVWTDSTTSIVGPECSLRYRTFRFSSAAGRAIPVGPTPYECGEDRRTDHWWVFDTTAALAYTLEGLVDVKGAAFSPDGDTLYVAAMDTADQWSVGVFGARNGTPIESLVVPGVRYLIDVLPDPVLPYLYVSSVDTDSRQRIGLHVYDRDSLDPVAYVVDLAGRACCVDQGWLVSGGGWGLFLVGSLGTNDNAPIWQYDLLGPE